MAWPVCITSMRSGLYEGQAEEGTQLKLKYSILGGPTHEEMDLTYPGVCTVVRQWSMRINSMLYIGMANFPAPVVNRQSILFSAEQY